MEITTFWDPWCVIFTYTPPFIFRIPPQLIVELEVSSVTRLSSVLIICWSQGGLVGDDMCSVGYDFVLSYRNRQMTYYTQHWCFGVSACGSINKTIFLDDVDNLFLQFFFQTTFVDIVILESDKSFAN